MLLSRLRRSLARALAPDQTLRLDRLDMEIHQLGMEISSVRDMCAAQAHVPPPEPSRYNYLGSNIGL